MLLTHGTPAQPCGAAHAQEPEGRHGDPYPDVLPEQPGQPSGNTGTQCHNKQNAAFQCRHLFPQQGSAGHAENDQAEVPPARHDPACVQGSVVVIEQGGDTVGVDFHPRHLEDFF